MGGNRNKSNKVNKKNNNQFQFFKAGNNNSVHVRDSFDPVEAQEISDQAMKKVTKIQSFYRDKLSKTQEAGDHEEEHQSDASDEFEPVPYRSPSASDNGDNAFEADVQRVVQEKTAQYEKLYRDFYKAYLENQEETVGKMRAIIEGRVINYETFSTITQDKVKEVVAEAHLHLEGLREEVRKVLDQHDQAKKKEEGKTELKQESSEDKAKTVKEEVQGAELKVEPSKDQQQVQETEPKVELPKD